MALFEDVLKFKDVVGKYIVQPLNSFGLAGFVFDVEGDSVATLNSEITDHYAEDNSFFQDHIAVRPKRMLLKSYVGELVYRLDESTDTLLQKVTRKLTTLNSYLPAITQGAQQAATFFEGDFSIKNVLNASSLNSIASLYASVKNLIPPTQRQQQAYMFFRALQDQKILVSVQTPFEFVTNMAIESIIATQKEDSKFVTDFAITLKEMRFASTGTVLFDPNRFNSPQAGQSGLPNVQAITPGVSLGAGIPNSSEIQRIPFNEAGTVQGRTLPPVDASEIFRKYSPSNFINFAPISP